jgi:hypothetical protein
LRAGGGAVKLGMNGVTFIGADGEEGKWPRWIFIAENTGAIQPAVSTWGSGGGSDRFEGEMDRHGWWHFHGS